MHSPSIVWLRDDLRLADNPALTAAAERGEPVILVYVLDEESSEVRPLGAASKWWLHHSLAAIGPQLVLRRGRAEDVLSALVAEVGGGAVFWNRRYGAAREIDARLKRHLRDAGVDVRSFQANLLIEPWTLTSGSGGPYRVFTPFWKAARELRFRDPLPAPSEIEWDATGSNREDLDDWGLLPTQPDWASGLREAWHPGEAGAHDQLEQFVDERLADYHRRDEPAIDSTSRLSPHLRFGEISPFQIWERLHGAMSPEARANVPKFLSEVGWREFNWSILFHSTELAERNYRPAYDAFPWSLPDPKELAAWHQGRTGIPLVDAGMRELWTTGTMHNRVRMVVASFLVKNLLIDWRVGEKWFWDTLVDADEASNPANWQWVAGSGADAAPYFRVFNPELQRAKFDRDGRYVSRWVPEVGTPLYPRPIVDLAETRKQALEAYAFVKAATDRQ
ncbi:MAG: deoxyribodipyrimidine photo-lyase [Salinibacterium sp.]|nr:deoxyribodipyrimidine photo-lyase [Salinibacterium sp.]